MSIPRIAIIGAGPAGLTLGVLLHKRHIPFTIFERRQKPTEAELATPSGMLDLHVESGLAALRECGLYDDFLRLTGECEESQIVSDAAGNILYTDQGELSERPEIARHALTGILSGALPPDVIRWEHKLFSVTTKSSSATETEREVVELDFGPHGKQVFDFVVGADGAWSAVRNLLTDVRPFYSGRQLVTLTIRHATSRYPHLSDLVGRGTFAALGGGNGVMTHRAPQDSVRQYVVFTTADEDFPASSGLAGVTAEMAEERILNDDALLGTWGEPIKELVAVGCEEETKDNPGALLDIKPLYMLPIGAAWESQVNATLIGDAAHLMCPWAGEGVNLAMWDSLSLAHAIGEAWEVAETTGVSFRAALGPVLKTFEVEMVERAKEKAEETFSNGEMMFGENAAQAFAGFFLSAMQGAQGS